MTSRRRQSARESDERAGGKARRACCRARTRARRKRRRTAWQVRRLSEPRPRCARQAELEELRRAEAHENSRRRRRRRWRRGAADAERASAESRAVARLTAAIAIQKVGRGTAARALATWRCARAQRWARSCGAASVRGWRFNGGAGCGATT